VLKLFQNIRPSSILLVFIAGLLLRVPILISGNGVNSYLSLNAMSGFFRFANQNLYVSVLLALVLVFVQSLIFNKLCIDHDVIYVHSYLPAYFFMIFNSIFIENLFINPIMFVNLFVLFSLLSMFRLYREQNASVILFYTALFYGTASLISPIMYSGFIFIVIGTIAFKNISIKDILSIISGYALPILLLWGVQSISGNPFLLPRINYVFNFALGSQIQNYIIVFYILAICAAGLIKTTFNYTKNNIKTRRISLLMAANLAFSIIIVLLRLNEYQLYFPLLAFALSIQFAYFLLGKKGRLGKEYLHYFLLAIIIYSLYGETIIKML
jgi:hypothetical protein